MTRLRHTLICIILAMATLKLHAQHYPAGIEGIKAGTLPAPGFTVEDDNSFYYFNHFSGFGGQLNDLKGFDYVQTPRLTWMTHLDFLDTDIGAGIRVPFAYKQTTLKSPSIVAPGGPIPVPPTFGANASTTRLFGLADIEVQPLLLAWHWKHFDLSTGYSFWAPTGDYDKNRFFEENIGQGYWTHSFMLGVTWYPDAAKTWAVSLLNHFDINMAQYSTLVTAPVSQSHPLGIVSVDTTLGDIDTLEWAVSKSIRNFDLGITGYYQQQVTATQGPTFFGPTYGNEWIHVAGVGPEIQYAYAPWGLSASLRYAYEFTAMDHTQGQLINLTFSKSF
jgi:hypothetical protein